MHLYTVGYSPVNDVYDTETSQWGGSHMFCYVKTDYLDRQASVAR